MRSRRVFSAALTVVVAVALSGCAMFGAAPAPTPTPTPSATRTPPAASGDGELRIGVLTPLTGEAAVGGNAVLAGVELAARELNDAGEPGAKPVLTFHRNIAGLDPASVTAAFEQLLTKGIDLVIGPSSTEQIEAILPAAKLAGVAVITPDNTEPALTSIEDDGLLARTIPDVGLQGSSLAALAGSGAQVAFFGSDDPDSVAIATQLSARLEADGGEVVLTEIVDQSETSFTSLVAEVEDADVDAVVIALPASAAAVTASLVEALTDARIDGADILLATASLGDYSQLASPGAFDGVRGTYPISGVDDAFRVRIRQADPTLADIGRSAEAYDAVIAAALAARLAGDESGASLSYRLPEATGGGIPCGSWAECLAVLDDDEDIDYEGISSGLGLTEAGDVSTAHFQIVEYGRSNTYEPTITQ